MYDYSISQNLKDVLKNRIKILISPILYNLIDFMVDNLFASNVENKYFWLISTVQSSTREMIKKIIISTFEEIDENFKISAERLSSYYINKSNVSRTLITIVGEITFLEHTINVNIPTRNSSLLIKFLNFLNTTTTTLLLKL